MNLRDPWEHFLRDILASEDKHYHWLRSLSYLEYIGYRKMVKALDYQEVHKGVFHHLSDEIRHSYMLKELAEKGFEGKYRHVHFEQPFIDIAENYFQDLDGEVKKWVLETTGEERPFLCYMLVSYLIEKRAIRVYPEYFAALSEAPLKIVIQKIIKDEKEHLAYIEDQMRLLPERNSFSQSHLWDFEQKRFLRFLRQFQECFSVTRPQSAPPIH